MGRPINRLSARAIASARPGYHADGGGLYLQVTQSGGRSWVYRYQRHGRRHEMGLGPADVVTLAEARQAAHMQRRILAAGADPLAERRAVRASAAAVLWGDAVDAFVAGQQAAWRRDAQAEQWIQSLRDYGPPRSIPVAAIDTSAVMDCLRPIWTTKTETATRVRGRIERVLDFARVRGWREGDNPARWRGHLDKLLPQAAKVRRAQHFASMPYAEMPAFMADLIARDALSARALAYTILTAARTGEVIGAQWSEFDGAVWTIPGERMKAGRPHVVPLSAPAVWLLSQRPRIAPPWPLGNMAMLTFLQRRLCRPYTVHGFRASLDTWATETTTHDHSVVDMSLAHVISDKTVAAYRRGTLLEKRRQLMSDWAAYLLPDWSPPAT